MTTMLGISIGLFLTALLLSRYKTHRPLFAFFYTMIIFVYLLLSTFYFIANYFTGEGINDAVLFHLRYGLDGSGYGDYYLIMGVGVVLFITSLVICVIYYKFLQKSTLPRFASLKRFAAILALCAAFIIHPSVRFLAETFLKSIGVENPLSMVYRFSDYYREPSLTPISESHPNLVYIFAESFENTYFDETIFPNLVTKLRPLREKALTFTQIEQAHGTSWTIAGMTSALCALPLVTPTTNLYSPQGNSMSKMNSFYSGATCMSDLLHKEGYKLVYRSGSPLSFAGVDKLYRTHGFDDVKGDKELKSFLKTPSYKTPWGFYDDTLFDIALNDFKRLSKNKQKFALFLSTMDTHHPYGHVSKSCQAQRYQNGDNSMLNAVACSDELIARFIKNIQDSPYGKNTVIVVGSDHLAMHNLAIDDLMKGERRNQLMILDPKTPPKSVDKKGSTLDVAPTLLPLLGYKTDMGLGRDLLSEEQSLEASFDHFDAILNAWSNEISRFWEFPKIDKEVVLSPNAHKIVIGKTSYRLPILLRLNDTLEVSPFFEVKIKFFETMKLFGYLQEFNDDDLFLWVDNCSRITKLNDANATALKGKYCYALGKLGADTIQTEVLKTDKSLSVEALQPFLDAGSNEPNAKPRRERIASIAEK
jgi:phosphoglycerol transferase